MPVEYKTERVDNVNVIRCPVSIETSGLQTLETAIKSWLVQDCELHVLDLSQTRIFSNAAYRPFILFSQQLKTNNKKMFCIGVPASLVARFKADGVHMVFQAAADLEDAKKRMFASKEKPSVNVAIINPFITATQTVLSTQASTPLKPGKPYMKKPDEKLPIDIAGHISLHSNEFNGSVTLCFPAAVFLKVYENMLGEKHTEISAEVQDAAGELLNIIFGQAKTMLNDVKGFTLDKALPTILVGDNLKIHHQTSSSILILPFNSDAGAFHVEIAIHKE